jgi:hypothetical protein
MSPAGLLPIATDLFVREIDEEHNHILLSLEPDGPPVTCSDNKTPRVFNSQKFMKVA